MITSNGQPKNSNIGSEWRKWDLQVQTILDDSYVSIDKYWDDSKSEFPDKCQRLLGIIGDEDKIKEYDSKCYFFTDKSDIKTKAKNYAKLFLNYLDIFTDNGGAVCLTDHNYDHRYLLDAFILESKKVKVIPGVEINVQGINMLILVDKVPYEKISYSDGIKTMLNESTPRQVARYRVRI